MEEGDSGEARSRKDNPAFSIREVFALNSVLPDTQIYI